MMLITHAAVGALIGHAAGTPLVAFAAGFLSHFILDMLPHGDAHLLDLYRKGKHINQSAIYLIADTVLTTAFLWWVTATPFLAGGWTVAAIAAALLPDFLVWLAEMTQIKLLMKYFHFHEWNHGLFSLRIRDVTLPAGIAVQVAILIIAFLEVL